MASSAMITVPTTASRFALLQIDSDSDTSESGKTGTKNELDSSGKTRQGKATGRKAAPGNDKKKDKKKKKKEQQQSEANEVRDCLEAASHACTCFHMYIIHRQETCRGWCALDLEHIIISFFLFLKTSCSVSLYCRSLMCFLLLEMFTLRCNVLPI